MARVIGVDEAKLKRVSCGNCAAIIEYKPSELRKVEHHDYGGGHEIHKVLTCPACGEDVYT